MYVGITHEKTADRRGICRQAGGQAGSEPSVQAAADALPRRPVVDCHGSRHSVCARRACDAKVVEALAPAL
jgi:hypothetical protein